MTGPSVSDCGFAVNVKRVEHRAIARDDDPAGRAPSFVCGHWSPDPADALAEYDGMTKEDPPYDAVWIEKRIVRETIEGPIRLRRSSVDKLRKAVG